MRSQPGGGDPTCSWEGTAMPPNLDVVRQHAQAWFEHASRVRGPRAVLAVVLLALIALSTAMMCYSVLNDPVALARYQNPAPIAQLFEAGAPVNVVATVRYKLVAD